MKKEQLLSHLPGRQDLALLVFLGLGAFAAQGQAINYSPTSVTNTSATYMPLGSTSTAIVVNDLDDANSAPQSIGFTFNYNGQSFTQFILNTNVMGVEQKGQIMTKENFAKKSAKRPFPGCFAPF
ncbi:hypothetical protein IC235_17750 [Hymenobacter sp. BT664]|uniref:Uncharacterized protein n=1 Tax=Hymenobacter montanus TaxID=2771359 RepID=A0A927BH02_9BACT|nr:hypothetical protein [Hymenobacter montanus]MBD2769738.1 hypothetical protein [Hymenobacter montanus]